MRYETVCKEFEDRGCKLLTSREEVEKLTCKPIPKFRYIASCNHEHEVFYNVFKSRGTGIKCPQCISTENSKKSKENFQNDKIRYIRLEKTCIDFFVDMVKDEFECIKCFDGCRTDIAMKPKDEMNDTWMGIQVKSTESCKVDYGFFLTKKDYSNLLILCICWEDKSMWLIPHEIIAGIQKLTIGLYKSKYSDYKLTKENWKEKFQHYYNNTYKYTFQELDTPNNIYQQREQTYRKMRDTKLDFIKFEYDNMEDSVYDFRINVYKIQEKVGGIHRRGHLFHLYKHYLGKKHTSYQQGDNDFYWLNVDNKKTFFTPVN